MKGVIIGAPHGITEPRSVNYAKLISQRIGAGFLIASGFAPRRLPLVRWTPFAVGSNDPLERGSIYREFKALLRQTANGNVKLYIGVRSAVATSPSDRIEVAPSGFTFEQLAILKESFVRIRDSALHGSSIPKIAIAIDLDGLKMVIEVFAEQADIKGPIPSPEKYIDLSYLQQAWKELGWK